MGLEEGKGLSRRNLRQVGMPDRLRLSAPLQPQQEQDRGGQRAREGTAERHAATGKAARASAARPGGPGRSTPSGAAGAARDLYGGQWQRVA